jgi:hypothetical protein
MSDRRVIVRGGGKNLYRISDYNGTYRAYWINVGFFWDDKEFIGKARSLEDALALIKSHSGRGIQDVS